MSISATTSARPAGKNAFRPRGAGKDNPDKKKEPEATFAEVLAPMRHIYGRYWRRSWWLLALVAVIVLASAITGVAAPYIFSRMIDNLQSGSLGETIVWGFAAYAALFGLSTALSSIVNYMAMMSAENLNYIAGVSFFQKLLKKQVSFFIEHNPAEIQSAKSRGQTAIYTLVQLGIIVLIPGIVQILASLGVLGTTINIEIVVIVVIYGLAFVAFTYLSNRWTRPFLDAAIKADQASSKFVGNSINAMETLRYFGGDDWIKQRFEENATEVLQSWTKWGTRQIAYAVVFGTALAVQFAITFAVLVPRYQAGELTVGDIVLFNALLLQLNRPFQMLGSAIQDLMRSYSRFLPFAAMWAAPEEPDTTAAPALHLRDGRIVFEDVGFAYRDETTVEHVSFAAQRGRLNFLTGPTGSGKTTIFKLALKSLEPKSGRILVDDRDLGQISRAAWYSVIGVVPQEIMLLNDTLESNIVLGRPLDEARLRRAAERASILKFIEGLTDKFATTVGERGLKLSGGERQRVAIARALYADPDILFLDEASSALDEHTEAEIMGELRRQADDMTIIAITHRKTVIAQGDNVVELTSEGVRERIAA
jgi:ABC-type multidrug transport system fused ATPase/permease subunit